MVQEKDREISLLIENKNKEVSSVIQERKRSLEDKSRQMAKLSQVQQGLLRKTFFFKEKEEEKFN